MSGAADRQSKIEAAVRTMLCNGWSKAEISNALYNIGIDRKDTANALAVIESEALEGDLLQAEQEAATHGIKKD